MEVSLYFRFWEYQAPEVMQGEGKARLEEDDLVLFPPPAGALRFPLRDVAELNENDYAVLLDFEDGAKLELSRLGYHFSDFLRLLWRSRNEVLIRDLLMNEALREPGVEVELWHRLPGGKGHRLGAELRLYETAVVVLPETGYPLRIPAALMQRLTPDDFALTLSTVDGEQFTFSKLGRRFDSTVLAVTNLMSELEADAQVFLQDLAPVAQGASMRKASRLLRDGRAVSRAELETQAPDIWQALEAKLEQAGLGNEYSLLRSLSRQDRLRLGFKRGLVGDLDGDYLWFLAPIYHRESQRPGNAVAFEAVSMQGQKRATYFFRLVGRQEYPSLCGSEDMVQRADAFLSLLNRALLEINFRREPIYLPYERLLEPENRRYLQALRRIPSLQQLRDHFIGRVMHRSPEQWQGEVMDLLQFNTASKSDQARWTGATLSGDDLESS